MMYASLVAWKFLVIDGILVGVIRLTIKRVQGWHDIAAAVIFDFQVSSADLPLLPWETKSLSAMCSM